jgi:hypothetical protein
MLLACSCIAQSQCLFTPFDFSFFRSIEKDSPGSAEAPHVSQHSPQNSPSQVQRALATRPPFVLPNDPSFTPSLNGRNGWNYENLYEVSTEVREDGRI